jgi:hypothetical protein
VTAPAGAACWLARGSDPRQLKTPRTREAHINLPSGYAEIAAEAFALLGAPAAAPERAGPSDRAAYAEVRDGDTNPRIGTLISYRW